MASFKPVLTFNSPFSRYGRRYCPLADFLVESGRLGLKSGLGWYSYAPNQREPEVDQAVIKLIDDYRKRNNIQIRQINAEVIIKGFFKSVIVVGWMIALFILHS